MFSYCYELGLKVEVHVSIILSWHHNVEEARECLQLYFKYCTVPEYTCCVKWNGIRIPLDVVYYLQTQEHHDVDELH